MARIDAAAAKWKVKTIRAFQEKWGTNVRQGFDAWIRGISEFTGIPEAQVRSSLAAQNYQEFLRNPEVGLQKALAKLQRPGMEQKWAQNFRRAFQG